MKQSGQLAELLTVGDSENAKALIRGPEIRGREKAFHGETLDFPKWIPDPNEHGSFEPYVDGSDWRGIRAHGYSPTYGSRSCDSPHNGLVGDLLFAAFVAG